MISSRYLALLLLFTIPSCQMKTDPSTLSKWKQEVKDAESNFAIMAKEKGIHKAFNAYAADKAVLMRNNALVSGKENIDSFYKGNDSKGLSWSPDFIEVAASGDLAYTYGEYTYSTTDSTGQVAESKGVFHTVWKRQEDGQWKFVWD